jgi:uncharacterized membrane protein YkoI
MRLTKNLFIGGALVSALALGATTVHADDMEWDGEENLSSEAQEAVDKAKQEFDGKVTEVEYEEDDGQRYYDIQLEKDDEDFDIKINADDLSVMEKDSDLDDDRDDDSDDDGDDDRDDDDDKEKSSNESKKVEKVETPENAVKLNKAFDKQTTKAIDKAKENFDGILESVSYEKDDGETYYQVNLENKDEEYEVKFNAKDFKVIEEETDDDSDDDFKRLEKAQDVKVMSFKEAKELAEKEAEGKVDEWDYDVDDFDYDFEIDDKEVTINAKTGEIVEIED